MFIDLLIFKWRGLKNTARKLPFFGARKNNFPGYIFLKLGNLSLAFDHISSLRRVEYSLIFQSLSLQDQKMKCRNNLILYTFLKKISLIRTLLKFISFCSKDLFWWRVDKGYHMKKHEFFSGFFLGGGIKGEGLDMTSHIGAEGLTEMTKTNTRNRAQGN